MTLSRETRLACLALALVACVQSTSGPATVTRTYTFKALSGISMGAIGATFLGATPNHTKLDAIAPIGGPLDVAYFLGGFEREQIGGWCSLAQLQQLAASNPAALNDPTALSCPQSVPFAYEHRQDFNHWQYTDNGGDFDRDSYLDLFYDLSLALGNPGYWNPESPIFPAPGITKDNFNNACTTPFVFNKKNGNPIYNAEFNPTGDYDVISFCDGQAPPMYCSDPNNTVVDWCKTTDANAFCASLGEGVTAQTASSTQNANLFYAKKGVYDPCYTHTHPASIGLAVDINGNGVRDYFEPVIFNGHERFSDVGSDGCADEFEDGKGGCTAHNQTGDPNHDNFDPWTNPFGTENNWVWDPGEPFEDNGLDGVPNTHDYGEGNGKYDDGPNRAHWLSMDFRQTYRGWSEAERQTLNVYADGGLRDVFNLGLSGDIVTSTVRWLQPGSMRYTDYMQLPPQAGVDWSMTAFSGLQVDWSKTGPNTFMLYGTPSSDVTIAEYRDGDGDHVGTPAQLIDRVVTFVEWLSYHWQKVLGEPHPINSTYAATGQQIVYYSNKLQGLRNFDISLPVGYDDPANANVRYPVFSMGHGYGMTAADMSNISAIFSGFAGAGYMLPMIIIYPSGRCCFVKPDGSKDCRDTDDNGVDLSGPPYNYWRECLTGNFYVNRQGYVPGDDTPYGDGVFEILDYVDQNFRTLGPKTVTQDATE